MCQKKREVYFYRDYFDHFYQSLNSFTQRKVMWVLGVIEEFERIPPLYFKHLEGTDGIYEIRVMANTNIYRIFCFFDRNNLVVVGHGFQKKTQKTPSRELERA